MITALVHVDWLTAIWIVVIGIMAMIVYARMTDVAVKSRRHRD